MSSNLSSGVNAALSTVRALGRTVDGRAASELEGARFQLWSALERADYAAAEGWLRALRANLLALGPEAQALAAGAVDDLTDAVVGLDPAPIRGEE